MNYHSQQLTARLLVVGIGLALTGCGRVSSEVPAPTPVNVTVSYPVEREVSDHAEFTGRTAAVDSVEVRAHVWGYLDRVNFKEGTLVKKGDVLFELDPRPYKAALEQAKAKVALDEAQPAYDEAEYQRDVRLVGSGAVTRSEFDKITAAGATALAIGARRRRPGFDQLRLPYLEHLGIMDSMKLTKDLIAASAMPLILSLLEEGESYGYAIIRRVRELSGGGIAWTDGMLYPGLHRLEAQGLIQSRWGASETGRKRKYYALRAVGKKALREQKEQWSVVQRTLARLWGAQHA